MAECYVGYGFYANKLDGAALLSIVRHSADAEAFEEYMKECDGAAPEEAVVDFVEDADSTASYVAKAINAAEAALAKKAGIDLEGESVVETYDQFVVFSALRFQEDEKRAAWIKSEADFQEMLLRHFPEGHVPATGSVWTGSDFVDANYWMD